MNALRPALFLLGFTLLPLCAQTDPGTAQDEEAARQKLLKAADQLDLLQTNSEATRAEVDGFKQQLAQLQQQNATLQQQNTDLQQQITALKDAFTKSEEARVKERQILLDEVAKMVAAGSAKPKKKPAASASTSSSTPAPPPDTNVPAKPEVTATTDTSDQTAPPVQKGYYHIVGEGETLTMIANAYRAQGVRVSVADIQKANNLTDTSILQVGQKLFIPKPGT